MKERLFNKAYAEHTGGVCAKDSTQKLPAWVNYTHRSGIRPFSKAVTPKTDSTTTPVMGYYLLIACISSPKLLINTLLVCE